MEKVKIYGLTSSESRIFEILDRKTLEEKIEELDQREIYERTVKKAYEYNMSGSAITYIDARNGSVHTYWLQNNQYNHPYDSYYEIVLCTVNSPVEFDTKDFFENEEEQEHYEQSELSLKEFFGENEYQYRLENIFDYWANEFEFDWENIKEQLDNLYSKICKE